MRKRSVEERIQRLEDRYQIQNLVGKFMYWGTAGMHDQVLQLFAQKTPGVTSEAAGGGVYDGIEGIRRSLEINKIQEGDRVGFMRIHTLTTPVIEISGDGKTAKGLWLAPGCTARKDVGGKLGAYWVWAKVGADFVREDSEWKIWHFQVYMIFQTLYEESWIESNKFPHFPRKVMPDELKPNRPTTYHHLYSPTGKTENIPAPPEPYESWDGKSMTTSVL